MTDIITEKFFKDGGSLAARMAKEKEIVSKVQAERIAKADLDAETKVNSLKAKQAAVTKALDE